MGIANIQPIRTLAVPQLYRCGRSRGNAGACDLGAQRSQWSPSKRTRLYFAALALPVPGRIEDLLTEQAVFLRLQRAVVDRLRLRDLTAAPPLDVISGSPANTYCVKLVDVGQGSYLPGIGPVTVITFRIRA
jgi:hypothetical protein